MLKKSIMRDIGKAVLESRGYQTRVVTSRGVLFGARLEAAKGEETFDVSVRSAQQRAVSFTRRSNGDWGGLSTDRVLIVVPEKKGATTLEVLLFESDELRTQLEAAAKALGRSSKSSKFDVPILLPLDRVRAKKGRVPTQNLKDKSVWSEIIDPSRFTAIPTREETLIERVKREFAEQNKVDVSKVMVEFKIIA